MSKNIKKTTGKGKKKIIKKATITTPSVEESLLLYRIKIKERKLEDLLFEVKLLEDEEKQYLDRIDFLKREQEILFTNLIAQKKLQKIKSQNEIKKCYTKEDALNELKENAKSKDKLQIELDELEKKNESKDKKIREQESILEKLIQYRDVDQYEMVRKMKKQKEEIEEENNKQIFMLDQLQKEFEQESETMGRMTSENMKQFKINEVDNAMKSLTRCEMRVISTNEWLKNEVAVHEQAVEKMAIEVQKMKEEFIVLIDELAKNNRVIPAYIREMSEDFGMKFSINERYDDTCREILESNKEETSDNKWPVTIEMLLNKLTNC